MNLSDENTTVLEGGISNIKYIWHTEPNACEKCQELDGTEYNSKKDVPEKPHPNCKCYIEEGIRKVIFEGNNLTEQIKDAKQDMKANEYGRQQGKTYPNEACEILIDVFRPNGLSDKY